MYILARVRSPTRDPCRRTFFLPSVSTMHRAATRAFFYEGSFMNPTASQGVVPPLVGPLVAWCSQTGLAVVQASPPRHSDGQQYFPRPFSASFPSFCGSGEVWGYVCTHTISQNEDIHTPDANGVWTCHTFHCGHANTSKRH